MTDDKREASYRAYEEDLRNAWKDPSPASSVQLSGDYGGFLMAVMAWHERDDIVPLLNFVQSDRPLSDENRRNLADLVEILHARSRPRRSGKPAGRHTRWLKPNYVVAFVAEKRLGAWKKNNGKSKAPAAITLEMVKDTIRIAKSWAMMRGKPPLKCERIIALLREPKNRRL